MARDNLSDLLREQVAYYSACAQEYDRMLAEVNYYLTEGGGIEPKFKPVLDGLEQARGGKFLELACGTGLWTQYLAKVAHTVLAIDASQEMLDLNRKRVPVEGVYLMRADIFDWKPTERFDLVFFGFWLTHVPSRQVDSFWRLVASSLKPGARFVMVDEVDSPALQAFEERLGGGEVIRTLENGRRYHAVKMLYRPESLHEKLATLGWTCTFRRLDDRFFWGTGQSP